MGFRVIPFRVDKIWPAIGFSGFAGLGCGGVCYALCLNHPGVRRLLRRVLAQGSASSTQRAQYPLSKEYTSNHNIKPLIICGIFRN